MIDDDYEPASRATNQAWVRKNFTNQSPAAQKLMLAQMEICCIAEEMNEDPSRLLEVAYDIQEALSLIAPLAPKSPLAF